MKLVEEYSYLANRIRTRFQNMTDEHVEAIIAIVMTTCSACWESSNDCQCWNDE